MTLAEHVPTWDSTEGGGPSLCLGKILALRVYLWFEYLLALEVALW